MEKVRIGVVGAGSMAQLVHLPGLMELPGCEVVALVDLRVRLGEQIAQQYRIPKVYQTHGELAQDPDVDAALVVTRDGSHAPVAIDLLAAGKHVLVEKPLATSTGEGAVGSSRPGPWLLDPWVVEGVSGRAVRAPLASWGV